MPVFEVERLINMKKVIKIMPSLAGLGYNWAKIKSLYGNYKF